jgi:ABC-type branched-subunit amino acid transport system ATPase component
MTEVILSARAVEKSFGRTQALRGVSLELTRGEVLAVTGPSGGGKSTLLHCLSGILRQDAVVRPIPEATRAHPTRGHDRRPGNGTAPGPDDGTRLRA